MKKIATPNPTGPDSQLQSSEPSDSTNQGQTPLSKPVEVKQETSHTPIPDLKSLLEANPALAQPVSVFIALLGLATIIKTLAEGFLFAKNWELIDGIPLGGWGVVLVIAGCILLLSIAMIWINRLMRNRPMIKDLPPHLLSHKPTIHWDFSPPDTNLYTFKVAVKKKGLGYKKTDFTDFAAPGTDFYNLYREKKLQGNLTISVTAMLNNKRFSTSSAVETEIYEDAVHRIKATNRIRVAVHTDPGDDVFCSYYKNEWHGFDIYLVNEAAEQLKRSLGLTKPLQVEFIHYPWPEVIAAPNEHMVDFAIASISISKEREEKYGVLFSEPYYTASLGVISREARAGLSDAGDNGEVSLDDLRGKKIAVHQQTTASILLDKITKTDDTFSIQIHTARDNSQISEWLKDGKVDIVMYDYERAFSMLADGYKNQKLEPRTEVRMDEYGLAFAPNNSRLRAHMDQIISTNRQQFGQDLKKRTDRKSAAA